MNESFIPVDPFIEKEKQFHFRYILVCFLAYLILAILMTLAAYFKICKPEMINNAYICAGVFYFSSGIFAGFLLKEI